jgi:hypothetical protein
MDIFWLRHIIWLEGSRKQETGKYPNSDDDCYILST